MKETLAPLSPAEKRVLELAAPFEPPAGAEQRVFEGLKTSIASAPPLPAAAAGAVGAKTVWVIATAMLAAGSVGGVLLGRTVLAPEPPLPQVVERIIRVEVPVPAPAQVAPLPPKQEPYRAAPVVRPEPRPEPASADELLARERERIDTARSALLRGDAESAITALQGHLATFPAGRLEEEREFLWIQALVMKPALPDAKARAAQFHQKFPRSLLGPAADAALGTR